ncbi:MAG: hypothetical protein IT451_02415 [Candidatus Brocadia sp.]|nr:hypothetical protein [Candidatus Brocadia sp.]
MQPGIISHFPLAISVLFSRYSYLRMRIASSQEPACFTSPLSISGDLAQIMNKTSVPNAKLTDADH